MIDFKMFSNKAITIVFEIPSNRLKELCGLLTTSQVKLFAESEKLLEEIRACDLDEEPGTEVRGTLQVTFIHNEPDLRIEIPAFE